MTAWAGRKFSGGPQGANPASVPWEHPTWLYACRAQRSLIGSDCGSNRSCTEHRQPHPLVAHTVNYDYNNYYPQKRIGPRQHVEVQPPALLNQRAVNLAYERSSLTEVDAYILAYPDGRIEMGQSVGRPEGELYIASRSLRYKYRVWRHQKIYISWKSKAMLVQYR